jgi:hypothetical protein
MKTVKRAKLTSMAMSGGNENSIKKVIMAGTLKEWVGIGWVDLREATESDKSKYPKVVD